MHHVKITTKIFKLQLQDIKKLFTWIRKENE